MARGNKRKNGLLAFIFLIPLMAIIIYVVLNSNQSISIDNVRKITVSAPDSKSVSIEDAADIEFFVNLMNGAQHTNSAIRDVSGETPVHIVCERDDKSVEYKLYPSLNVSGCILVSPDGEPFVLESEPAKKLLLRSEFDYLYADYFLPTLNVVSGDTTVAVAPVDSEWQYYKTDDVAYEYAPENYATGEEIYTVMKGLENSLVFTPGNDILPYNVTEVSYITEDGNEFNIDSISQLDLSVDTVITVSLKAEWSSKNSARAFGSAEYKFDLLYDIPATLEVDLKEEYTAGEIITVYATNLNAGETVKVNTLLDIPQIGFGYVDEDTSVAFLPIGLENGTREYSLNLEAAVDKVTEEINVVTPDGGEWATITATTQEYLAMLSPEKLDNFYSTLASVTETRPETDYFQYEADDNLLDAPVTSDARFEFGQNITLGVTDISGDSGNRTCEGMIYELEAGTPVRAAQNGEVVFCGELATTGNTVVIYHGYGIYSYYFHLDGVDDLRVGTVVNGGRILGEAGSTGFTSGKTVLNFAVSIDGIFVNPQCFLG